MWTPPHFWALALYRNKEYAQGRLADAAGHPWLGVHPIAILLYSSSCSLPRCCLSLRNERPGLPDGRDRPRRHLLRYAFRLWRAYSDALSRRPSLSILDFALLFAALLADHYLWPLIAWTSHAAGGSPAP